MSQISYNILSVLIKQSTHIREIAKKLNSNPMTISRETKKMEEENILDFRQEGKNKVYFIKNSLEAKEQIKSMEHIKLIELISKNNRLRTIVETIKKEKKVQLAIIFGSYAKKTETKNSDIDLYIEGDNKNFKKELELIDSKLSIKTGSFDKNNLLIKEIIKNHVIIKGVDKYYELIHKETN